jgi:hypothetical protein
MDEGAIEAGFHINAIHRLYNIKLLNDTAPTPPAHTASGPQ